MLHRKRSHSVRGPLPSPPALQSESTTATTSSPLNSLCRTVSPPPIRPKRHKSSSDAPSKSAAAAIEAGEKHVSDHLTFYSSHLLRFIQPTDTLTAPRLSHAAWTELYRRNADSLQGCHFVIHQHDHSVAGTHYDLRLQCNPTSSISFAIMYGLPGNPNSRRLNRNATETRVHCLWNHLIETASLSTGSMLLWDTGEYEVLPYEKKDEERTGYVTDDTNDYDDEWGQRGDAPDSQTQTQQQKLKCAFQGRKIKVRLHGTRLPKGYTLSLRLTKDNFRSEQPKPPSRRRRRAVPGKQKTSSSDSDSETESEDRPPPPKRTLSSLSRLESPPLSPTDARSSSTFQTTDTVGIASDDEEEIIRENNAYIGATNDIGSMHQRKWFLSVDRGASGFLKKTAQSAAGFTSTVWLRKEGGTVDQEDSSSPNGFEKFIVGGRDTERSVLTGRLASEILTDEGVIGYIPRGLWRPVTE